jgi:4-hydroxy-tetrahydrodipicolinate synthase
MFKGSIVAIVTPFQNGKVDEKKLRELLEFQIESGTNGIVPCGTTGESPTLSHDEHDRVVEICIETVDKRIPVIAGTGSNSTAEAIRLTQQAAKAGADGALVVTPYYNKPMQEGLYLHFKAVAESVNIPIILYNIASRTARNIETETVARLARDCKNIVGVKEASGSLDQIRAVKKMCPKEFLLFSGDDLLTLPVLEMRGVGVISVLANILPEEVLKLIRLFNDGDREGAKAQHAKLEPLIKALFIETNPIPIKEAMGLMGLCSSEVRLPLSAMSEENKKILKDTLDKFIAVNTSKGQK